ncbi:MAG: T9SS type A sorting domain-containing protein, partial [Bacteroidia bacterium]
ENYPNPTSHVAYVSFKLHETATVNLSIYNLQGKLLGKVIQNQKRGNGKYVEQIDFDKLNISAGTYFMRLDVNGKTKTLKMVVVE